MNALDTLKGAGRYAPEDPTPLLREIPPSEPYPLEAMGPLQAAAEAIHDMTQAPPAIGAQSVLGVASLAAQGLVNAETLAGPAPASLFLLTIAKSGERKSACDRLAMRPVQDFEDELRAASGEDLAAFQNRHAVWEAEKRRILAAPRKGENPRSRTEMLADLEALGLEPEPPLYPSIISGEPTFEGLTKHMHRLRPALGLFSDEGGAFVGGHGMNSDNRLKTISGLSGLWDGTPVDRWRAGDGVQVFAGRRLAAHIMAQPVAAAELVGDPLVNGQGFLARFLLAEPPSAIGTRTRIGHKPESETALADYAARIGDLLRRELPLRENTRNELDPPLLSLSAEARTVLQDYALAVEKAQATGRELEAAQGFASKAAEHAARIAAVLAVYAGESRVSGEAMANAVKLATFYVNEAARLADAAKISRETADADKLRKWLVESWAEPFVSVTDATQFGPSSLREAATVRRLFQMLAANGWLALAEGGAEIRGRWRREAWRVIRGGVQ